MLTGPQLERALASASEQRRGTLLLALGRLDELALELPESPAGGPWAVLTGRWQAARGEFMLALEVADPVVDGTRRLRAEVLAILGRGSAALQLLDDKPEPEDRRVAARVHLALGEAGAAAVDLALGSRPSPDADSLLRAIDAVDDGLLGGAIAVERRRPAEAVALLSETVSASRRLGSLGRTALALSRLGEAHADLGHRWRALRCTVQAADLAAQESVPAADRIAILYRAFLVYGMFGHRALSESALGAAHHLVIQLASGIEEHAYRETFLVDNRDCQRIVAAWKGDLRWGLDEGHRS